MIFEKHTLENIVKEIEALELKTDKIIIVGSLALCAYGLLKEFDDVDIIPIFGDGNLGEKRFGKYGIDFLNNKKAYRCGYSTLYIKSNNILFNLLDEDNVVDDTPLIRLSKTVYLTPPLEIIKIKIEYDREKDLEHINSIKSVLKKVFDKKKSRNLDIE